MSLEDFQNVPIEVLVESAAEDFAVELKDPKDLATVVADLEAEGVDFDLFVQARPAFAPVSEVIEPVVPVTNAVTAASMKNAEEATVTPQIRTAAPAVPSVSDSYLVVMNRKNPYFEFVGAGKKLYKFTKDNPYNVMDAASTTRILEEEDGFAIATPKQLQEFYA